MEETFMQQNGCLHPGRLTWNITMEVWKMIFLFNCVIVGSMLIFRGVK